LQKEVELEKQINLEDQKGRAQLWADFSSLLKNLSSFPAVMPWHHPTWIASSSPSLQIPNKQNWQIPRAVRLGEIQYPQPINAIAPFLLNLAECRNIFIKTTPETSGQGERLLKSIVARLVLTNPIMSSKFIFIDSRTLGTFSTYYSKLPAQIGNYNYSSIDEILEQMSALESHKKWVQGKIGNRTFEAYNQSATLPEMYRIVCVSGFPNSSQFTQKSLAFFENIIESGHLAGIHVIAQIEEQVEDFSKLGTSLKKALQSGAVLTPKGSNWLYSFGNESYLFSPDQMPDMQVFDNLFPQIKSIGAKISSAMDEHAKSRTDVPMNLFLCHSSEDKQLVREIYRKLCAEKWLSPWLDEERLLPGQKWEDEIEITVSKSDAVIVFLSNRSVTKEGYVQKELKMALDIADEKPEGTIFIIPLRLEECVVPSQLKKWQWIDYFPFMQREEKYQRLLKSLRTRYETRPSK
jgi:hypothetical protein